MEVGENDIGHVLRRHAQRREVLHKRPRPLRIGVGTDAGVHQGQPVPLRTEEPTHLDGQQAAVIEELRMLAPLLLGLVEQRGRWPWRLPSDTPSIVIAPTCTRGTVVQHQVGHR